MKEGRCWNTPPILVPTSPKPPSEGLSEKKCITPRDYTLIPTYFDLCFVSFLRLTFFLQNPLRVGPVYWAEWNNRCHLAAQLRQTNSLTTPRGCCQCVMRQLHSQRNSQFGGGVPRGVQKHHAKPRIPLGERYYTQLLSYFD